MFDILRNNKKVKNEGENGKKWGQRGGKRPDLVEAQKVIEMTLAFAFSGAGKSLMREVMREFSGEEWHVWFAFKKDNSGVVGKQEDGLGGC